ncbi:GTPase HflX [Paenibacillus albidus]|uniref:GTPase HflX n=1 Tax=Paenibacillus albidus TaxID=2041023 RepID=UPI001BE64274|nr:GTPase HflX [Paenibacillus albidus]MBT2288989.1 GTPase HflX [Paenibacillus albidus]
MQQPIQQQAIIVGVQLQNDTQFTYSMEELANLAAACNLKVIGQLSQKASRINPSHYIGTGKIEELRLMLADEDTVVIFNSELSPSQIRNLESSLDRHVIDRTLLILNIFADRAKTKEAQLQVEVAQLQYMLPRLSGMRESLGRQGGGAGLKNKGAGETKLELDRRRIEERITALQSELQQQVDRRQVQRKQRRKNEVPVVCLVGYTNSGKSTLMNAVVDTYHPESLAKQVFAKDMLFATLETSVRSIELPGHRTFLLTDTVGFVSQLPHHLVKAFRSTLEEVTEADLLIHVVDYADPQHLQHMAVTNETLKALGVEGIPTLYAYNKADLTQQPYPLVEEDRIYLSARHKRGIDELAGLIRSRVFSDYVECELLVPFDRGEIVSYFNEHAHVQAVSYEENGTRLTLECRAADAEKYRAQLL